MADKHSPEKYCPQTEKVWNKTYCHETTWNINQRAQKSVIK